MYFATNDDIERARNEPIRRAAKKSQATIAVNACVMGMSIIIATVAESETVAYVAACIGGVAALGIYREWNR